MIQADFCPSGLLPKQPFAQADFCQADFCSNWIFVQADGLLPNQTFVQSDFVQPDFCRTGLLCNRTFVLPDFCRTGLQYIRTFFLSGLLSERLYLIFAGRGFGLCSSPAEGVEHVAEGDGHIDEDDQGEQGI